MKITKISRAIEYILAIKFPINANDWIWTTDIWCWVEATTLPIVLQQRPD